MSGLSQSGWCNYFGTHKSTEGLQLPEEVSSRLIASNFSSFQLIAHAHFCSPFRKTPRFLFLEEKSVYAIRNKSWFCTYQTPSISLFFLFSLSSLLPSVLLCFVTVVDGNTVVHMQDRGCSHAGLCIVITDHYTNHRDSDRKGKWHCCTMVTQTCCRPGLQYPPLQAEATARHLKGPHLFPSFRVSVSPILGGRLWGVVQKATTHPEEIRILLHVPREKQKLRNTCVDIQHCMFLRLTLGMATMIFKKMSESTSLEGVEGSLSFALGQAAA